MNALPLLGIEVRHSDGEPILALNEEDTTPKVASINLVSAVSILSQKGCVVCARISVPDTTLGDHDVPFEPNHKVLDPLEVNVDGITSHFEGW